MNSPPGVADSGEYNPANATCPRHADPCDVGRACTIGARCSVAGTRSPGRTARSTPLARTGT
ncbi:MAG: hypothetical protein EXR79_13190 [Myxococcales bacterium]|nr:hypothetical protein [Myxococcales bacterium]